MHNPETPNLIRCPQCGTEAPKSAMRSQTIVQRGRNPQTNRPMLINRLMLFCKDKACGSHYQMGCEG
ncbi:hypothetical protein Pfra02_04140 [Pseudomonas fragi]|nr:hypothetical protein Pfra02_04140 [Pseudomonas fragi]